ncbi:hypothetical protein [Bradyrhizobium sp. BR 1432]|uniref:hypothetical protein n=1 Tax=Bradyrhizobium sp. BR 1432 TaxID=3447966 RepID=UPI003EE4D1EF
MIAVHVFRKAEWWSGEMFPRHCERSEAIQNLSAERLWIAPLLAMTACEAMAKDHMICRRVGKGALFAPCPPPAVAKDVGTLRFADPYDSPSSFATFGLELVRTQPLRIT